MKTNRKIIFALTAFLTLSIVAIAYAHGGDDDRRDDGYGYGYGHMMGPGYGYGHMMGPGYGYGNMMGRGYGYMMGPDSRYGHMRRWDGDDGWHRGGCDNWRGLPDDTVNKLDASRHKFYNDTRELRDQIGEKEAALNREMNKVNPDRDKVLALQKEVSHLQSDFDQKALNHRLDVQKMLPEDYRADGYGGGYCW